MVDEPEDFMLQYLRQMRAEIGEMRTEMATKSDVAELKSDIAVARSEMGSLRADVAADIHALDHKVTDQVVGLRRAVVAYHSSVIGHGSLISDLEARVQRVEQHLNLEPYDKH